MLSLTSEQYIPGDGCVLVKCQKAPHANANVSSSDLRHRLPAPTFPPVTCKTEYNREAEFASGIGMGLGDEPLRYFSERDVKDVCRLRCSVG